MFSNTVVPAMMSLVDVLFGLSYGESLDLITKHELHWLIPAIQKINRRDNLRVAFPLLFEGRSKAYCRFPRWIFQDVVNDEKHIADFLARIADEARISFKNADDRSDIVTTLLKAYDSKTGLKLSDTEAWEEAKSMLIHGKALRF